MSKKYLSSRSFSTSAGQGGSDIARIATSHQLAHRTLLSGIMRVCDLILLLVVVLAARHLGTEQFGLFMFALTLATVIVSPISEAFTPVVSKLSARYPERVGKSLGVIVLFQILLMGGFLAASWVVLSWLHWNATRQQVMLIMVAALGLRGPLEVLRSAVRGLGRFDVELITVIVERFLLLTSVIIALRLGGGPRLFGACFVVTRIVSVVVALSWLRHLGHALEWRLEGLGQHIRAAVPYGVTKWIAANYDQIGILCLGWLATDAITGNYSAAFRLIDGISSFPQILVMVLLPELTIRHGVAPQRVASLVRKTTIYTAMLTLPLAAGFWVEAPWLIGKIYGSGYAEAVVSFRLLSLGMLFLFTKEIARTTLWAIDQENAALFIMALGLAANAGLNVLLIPSFGAMGAALAMSISAALVWAALWWRLSRYRIQWPWKDAILKPGVVALAVALALWGLRQMAWPVRIFGATVIASVTLVATKAVTRMEWDLVRGLLGRLALKPGR